MSQIFEIRAAQSADVESLFALENASFEYDKLTKRRIRYWISAPNAIFMVACDNSTQGLGKVMAYALVIMRKGSRSARLYSIASDKSARGHKLGERLLLAAEAAAVEQGLLFMRLEVAIDNQHAISLYERLDYKQFGLYKEYYENKADALRMQKAIKQLFSKTFLPAYPWYQQTTEFTCGAAALMMAGAALDAQVVLTQNTELDIWRQATSIYMTSGHGGSHPIGLALAAKSLGMTAEVYINIAHTPFIDGVRSAHKKALLNAVHQQFCDKSSQAGIQLHYAEPDIQDLRDAIEQGKAVICLISTYQFDEKKVPHWVAITHIDDTCLYIHDPDLDEDENPIDYQHIPIAVEDFAGMATYGKQKLRTCLVLSK
ncbi:peptidase C39 family protein [Glaciecola sp. SC05]|uniref:peptidase C39 family protein n=1 Tax=Glaciecola sp. SC05 TaxID=1987355 RepID=UPI003526F5C3